MFFKRSQLRDFLKHLTDNYTILKLENWDSQNGIILRHDVDLDVSCAFEMAQIEAEYQAFGTYLFMTTHPSYNVSMLDNRRKLREMSDMGFEIGLHFDPLVYGDVDNTVMKSQVDFEATVLSNITGKEVRS